jgi:hypothetical protein
VQPFLLSRSHMTTLTPTRFSSPSVGAKADFAIAAASVIFSILTVFVDLTLRKF